MQDTGPLTQLWCPLLVNRETLQPAEELHHECFRCYCLMNRDTLKSDSLPGGSGDTLPSGRTAEVTRHAAVHGEAGLEGEIIPSP